MVKPTNSRSTVIDQKIIKTTLQAQLGNYLCVSGLWLGIHLFLAVNFSGAMIPGQAVSIDQTEASGGLVGLAHSIWILPAHLVDGVIVHLIGSNLTTTSRAVSFWFAFLLHMSWRQSVRHKYHQKRVRGIKSLSGKETYRLHRHPQYPQQTYDRYLQIRNGALQYDFFYGKEKEEFYNSTRPNEGSTP